jgi:hypothetical protein
MFVPVDSPQAREIAIAASEKMKRVIDRLPTAPTPASSYEYAI